MLPKQHRLRHTRDVARVRRTRPVARGVLFSLRAARQLSPGPSRFAVVVSRQVSPKATERNALSRQVRALLSERLGAFLPGWDVVIVGTEKFPAYSRPKIAGELERLLQKLRILP